MQVLWVLWALSLGAASATTLQKRLIADDIVKSVGARCGSGSPAGYYHAAGKGENATKYVIFFQGGGECRTKANCDAWMQKGRGDSSNWAATKQAESGNVMDGDCGANPDFCSWAKIFVPYCTGDMHSGTQTKPSTALGGYYFSGHNGVVGLIQDMKSLPSYETPTHALITGSSAGGIGALMHTDFFASAWPSAVVKGAPECGFFYAGVTAKSEYTAGSETPVAHLGFIEEWKPFLPSACAAATGGNMSICTDAHFLYPHLKSPLFIRENQYDTAKLQNCGFDARSGGDAEYLKAWGTWMRAQLQVISQSPKDGFFSASCLQHGGNFGFDTSPVVNGVNMRDALSNWYFEKGNKKMQYVFDDCGDLPCTQISGSQRCPHYGPSPGPGPAPGPSPTPSPSCQAEFAKDCPGLKEKGQNCKDCIHSHAGALKAAGCSKQARPVINYFCGSGAVEAQAKTMAGKHYVCDLSDAARESRFGNQLVV